MASPEGALCTAAPAAPFPRFPVSPDRALSLLPLEVPRPARHIVLDLGLGACAPPCILDLPSLPSLAPGQGLGDSLSATLRFIGICFSPRQRLWESSCGLVLIGELERQFPFGFEVRVLGWWGVASLQNLGLHFEKCHGATVPHPRLLSRGAVRAGPLGLLCKAVIISLASNAALPSALQT